MSQLTLQDHPVWQDLSQILEDIDSAVLLAEHLKICDYKILGYWDEQDNYYEEIILPAAIESELVSSSVGFTGKERFVQLKFILKAPVSEEDGYSSQKVAEVTLIYDENLEFLDEAWLVDINSSSLRL
jgi:hypothetical protein